jgi:deazaflavin-dependent oxidoreductase (nitroreductase family)
MRKLIFIALLAGLGYYLYQRSKLPVEHRDLALRRLMNERLTPIFIGHGAADGERTGLGIVEHVGRKSGVLRRTLIHPIVMGDRVAIPLAYTEKGQWPQNVIAAGCCRLQFHDHVYRLANPRAVDGSEIEDLPPAEKAIGRAVGGRYLLLDVDAVAPGRFEDEAESAGTRVKDSVLA